jgi:antigen flippase
MSTDQVVLPIQTPRAAEVERADAALARSRRRLSNLLTRFSDTALVFSVGTSFGIYFLTAVQGVFLARLLGPTARGEYGTAIFYTQALTYVGLLGTQLSIARRAARRLDQPAILGRAALRLGALTGLGTMALVSLLALVALPAGKSYLAPLCIACALYLPSEHMRLSLLAIDHGSGHFTRYNLHRLLSAVVYPLMLLVVWLSGFGSLKLVAALSILVPIVPLAVRLLTEPYAPFGPASPAPQTLVKEGLPYALAMLASDLLNRLDVLLILWLATFSVQGYYAAAVPAVSLLVVAPNTMALFAFNAGARQDAAQRPGKLAATIGSVVGFQSLTAAAFAAVLAPLMVLVYGHDFGGAVPFALALLPASALTGCSVVAEGYLQGRGRSTVGVWCRLRGAVVMLACVWLFWGRWHELSIPLAAIAGQAVSAVWMLWAVVREATADARLKRD